MQSVVLPRGNGLQAAAVGETAGVSMVRLRILQASFPGRCIVFFRKSTRTLQRRSRPGTDHSGFIYVDFSVPIYHYGTSSCGSAAVVIGRPVSGLSTISHEPSSEYDYE